LFTAQGRSLHSVEAKSKQGCLQAAAVELDDMHAASDHGERPTTPMRAVWLLRTRKGGEAVSVKDNCVWLAEGWNRLMTFFVGYAVCTGRVDVESVDDARCRRLNRVVSYWRTSQHEHAVFTLRRWFSSCSKLDAAGGPRCNGRQTRGIGRESEACARR
jgi:hypothetical protein